MAVVSRLRGPFSLRTSTRTRCRPGLTGSKNDLGEAAEPLHRRRDAGDEVAHIELDDLFPGQLRIGFADGRPFGNDAYSIGGFSTLRGYQHEIEGNALEKLRRALIARVGDPVAAGYVS